MRGAGAATMMVLVCLAWTLSAQARGPGSMGPAGNHPALEQQTAPEDNNRLLEIMVELAWLADPVTFPYFLEARVQGPFVGRIANPSSLEVSGYVPSPAVREKALKLARLHCPLAINDALKDHAHPAEPAPRIPAGQLQRAAQNALAASFAEPGHHFKIQCDAVGTVRVLGFVRTFEEKLAVSQGLRRLHGCTCVVNLAHVTPDSIASSRQPAQTRTPAKTRSGASDEKSADMVQVAECRTDCQSVLTPEMVGPAGRPVVPASVHADDDSNSFNPAVNVGRIGNPSGLPDQVRMPKSTWCLPGQYAEKSRSSPIMDQTSQWPVSPVSTLKKGWESMVSWTGLIRQRRPVPVVFEDMVEERMTPSSPGRGQESVVEMQPVPMAVAAHTPEPPPMPKPAKEFAVAANTWQPIPPTALPKATAAQKPSGPTPAAGAVEDSLPAPALFPLWPPLIADKNNIANPIQQVQYAVPALNDESRVDAKTSAAANDHSPGSGPISLASGPAPVANAPGSPAPGAFAYQTRGVVFVADRDAPPLPKSPNHLKQRIADACGLAAQNVQLVFKSDIDVEVRLPARNQAEAKRLAQRVMHLPELLPYRVDVQVKMTDGGFQLLNLPSLFSHHATDAGSAVR